MVRVGVDGGDNSSELNTRPRENIAVARPRPGGTTRADTHSDANSPGSSWKGQLTKSLSKRRDLLLTPPQQQEPSKHPAVTREMLRAMPLRPWLRFYLSRPEESTPGWVIHHCVIVVLVLNTCVLAVQTLDGPHFTGAAPAYPFLPSASVFTAAERAFSALYVAEFAIRWATASSQRKYWRAKQTWVGLLALLPIFVDAGAQLVTNAEDTEAVVATVVYNLRLVRVLRIPVLSRVHVGSKVMFDAISKSVAPLRVTVLCVCLSVFCLVSSVFALVVVANELRSLLMRWRSHSTLPLTLFCSALLHLRSWSPRRCSSSSQSSWCLPLGSSTPSRATTSKRALSPTSSTPATLSWSRTKALVHVFIFVHPLVR